MMKSIMQRNSVDNEMIDFLWIWMRIQRPVTTPWSYILQLWQAQCDYMISITIQIKLWSLNDWFNNDHCFISMIGWWIWIVLSMCCYQHLTIACPSGVCERCCTYGLTRTQVNALQSQWVCVCVCVTPGSADQHRTLRYAAGVHRWPDPHYPLLAGGSVVAEDTHSNINIS